MGFRVTFKGNLGFRGWTVRQSLDMVVGQRLEAFSYDVVKLQQEVKLRSARATVWK